MEEILRFIQSCEESQLRLLMRAISDRYAESYPQWDVLYIAVHKEPILRRRELSSIVDLLDPKNDEELPFHLRLI